MLTLAASKVAEDSRIRTRPALDDFSAAIHEVLRTIPVSARRIRLATDFRSFTPTMLRSVFGLALKRLSEDAYRAVFDPPGSQPRPYVIRPIAAEPEAGFEFIISGNALRWDFELMQAWEFAGRTGFTFARSRFPFCISEVVRLESDGMPAGHDFHGGIWSAHQALPTDVDCRLTDACCVYAISPLRLLSSEKQNGRDNRRRSEQPLLNPTLADIAKAGLRRVCQIANVERQVCETYVRTVAELCPATSFEKLLTHSTERFSRTQNQRLRLDGVVGRIHVPGGLQQLLPLFAALQWLHVGKGAVQGLGRIEIRKNAD